MNYVKGIEEAERRKAEREALMAKRRRTKRISHAIAGAMIFAFFHVVMGCIGYTSFSGLFVGAAIFAAVGAVAGLVISWRYPSMGGGAVVGTVVLMSLIVILRLIFGTLNASTFLFAFAAGLLGGGIPGAFVGLHASMDY